MPKPQGLQQKGNTWFLRKRVPKDLVDIYKKKEIIRTLETSDYHEAVARLYHEQAKIQSEFKEHRAKIAAVNDNPDILSSYADYQLEGLVLRWFADQEKKQHVSKDLTELTEEEKQDIETNMDYEYRMMLDEVKGVGEDNIHHGMSMATRYLKERGITFIVKSENFKKLGYLFSRAICESNMQKLRFWQGKAYLPSDALFSHSNALFPQAQTADVPLKSITLEELIEEYLEENKYIASTEKNYRIIFRALRELLGSNKLLHEITFEDCRMVRDTLRKMPSNARKKVGGNKSMKEAVAIAKKKELPLLKPSTVNGYIEKLVSLFNYARKMKYISENPAEGLKVKVKKKQKDLKDAFSLEQLNKIFYAPLYTGCVDDNHNYNKKGVARPKNARFWVPLIALYSGMRLNEICQLEVNDLFNKDGVNLIYVREDGEGDTKKLKTEASTRLVPVHPELEKIGFITYAETMRKSGEVKLFPELKTGSLGYYSDNFSKWFSRFLKSIGAKTKKTSFHSFRHTFRTAMAEAELPYDAIVAIGGWTSDSTQDNYFKKLKPVTLYNHMCKVRYPELDLGHLYEESAKDGQSCNIGQATS